MTHWAKTELRTIEIGNMLIAAASLVRQIEITASGAARSELVLACQLRFDTIAGLINAVMPGANAGSVEELVLHLRHLAKLRRQMGGA